MEGAVVPEEMLEKRLLIRARGSRLKRIEKGMEYERLGKITKAFSVYARTLRNLALPSRRSSINYASALPTILPLVMLDPW